MDIKAIWKSLKGHFDLLADKEDEQAVIEQVSNGVVFRGTNLWILIFAIFIASLGLNVNSTAVIIGAMLVSPLMGPIIGMGLSVGINDYDLLKRAVKNYAIATLISVVTATVYFLISPLSEARSELLARTSPSLYDVLIAFCGGAAGVLALTTKSKGQVIPGVAIATALMPPLCTAGYGLATAQWSYFFGAFYLFFINTVFIAISTFLGVKLLRFHSNSSLPAAQLQYGRRVIMVVVIITLIPAAFMTVNIIKKEVRERNVASFVNHELKQPGTQIVSTDLQHDTLTVVAVGRLLGEEELAEARGRMGFYGMSDHTLAVYQGADASDITARIAGMASKADAERMLLTNEINDLKRQLDAYTQYDTLSLQVTAEAQQLFPYIGNVRLGKLTGGNVALVECKAEDGKKLETDKTIAWLRTRLRDEGLTVLFI